LAQTSAAAAAPSASPGRRMRVAVAMMYAALASCVVCSQLMCFRDWGFN